MVIQCALDHTFAFTIIILYTPLIVTFWSIIIYNLFIVSIGHNTVIAKTTYIGTRAPVSPHQFDFSLDYPHQEELYDSNPATDVNNNNTL